jgi:hypothetical protein
MRTRGWISSIAVLLSLLATGCTDTGAASDNDRHGGFYGGVSGGMSRP